MDAAQAAAPGESRQVRGSIVVTAVVVSVMALATGGVALDRSFMQPHGTSAARFTLLEGEVSALQAQLAAVHGQLAAARSSARSAQFAIASVKPTVTCLQKWQNKLRGVQPSFLVPANGYPADDYLVTLTGVFQEC